MTSKQRGGIFVPFLSSLLSFPLLPSVLLSLQTSTLRLGGGKRMEWNGMEKKKKEYFKNILSFPLFRSLSRREWKDHSLV
jgi:hypothetical protein